MMRELPEYAYFWEHLGASELAKGLQQQPEVGPKQKLADLGSKDQTVGSPAKNTGNPGVPEDQDDNEDFVPWIGDLWDDQLSQSDAGSDTLTADLLDDEDVPFTESEVEEFDVSVSPHTVQRHWPFTSACHNSHNTSNFSEVEGAGFSILLPGRAQSQRH